MISLINQSKLNVIELYDPEECNQFDSPIGMRNHVVSWDDDWGWYVWFTEGFKSDIVDRIKYL